MLKERLTPTATLLYYWLQNHHFAGQSDSMNLQNFRVWSGEFLEEPVSCADLERSVARLQELGLVRREDDALTLVPEAKRAVSVSIKPLPETLWKAWQVKHYVAFLGLAIASAVLLLSSGFVLVQNTSQVASNPELNSQRNYNLEELY